MKLVKKTAEYTRYEIDPQVMVIVSTEGIVTFEQNGNYVTVTIGELKELINEKISKNNKKIR